MFGAHRNAAAFAFDQAHQCGNVPAQRHEIGDSRRAARGLEARLENQRIAAIGSRRARRGVGRANEPAAVLRLPSSAAKQAPESKRGQHSQSIEPSRVTKAAVSQSPMMA
jgi:hypothetical protein